MPQKPPHVHRGEPIDADQYNQLIDLAGMYAGASGAHVIVDSATGVHARQVPRSRAYIYFRVKLVQSGGSNATSAATAATWTYDCFEMTDTANERKLNQASSGAAVSPEKPRGLGTYSAATAGVGYRNIGGAFVLAEAYETPGTEECT